MNLRRGAPFLATRTEKAIIEFLLEQDRRIDKMALDVNRLTQDVSDIEGVIPSVEALLTHVIAELKDLRAQAGGALQPQLDALAQRLEAAKTRIGAAVAAGTAADQEAQDHADNTPTADQVIADQKAKFLDALHTMPADQAIAQISGLSLATVNAWRQNDPAFTTAMDEIPPFQAPPGGAAQQAADSLNQQANNAP